MAKVCSSESTVQGKTVPVSNILPVIARVLCALT